MELLITIALFWLCNSLFITVALKKRYVSIGKKLGWNGTRTIVLGPVVWIAFFGAWVLSIPEGKESRKFIQKVTKELFL